MKKHNLCLSIYKKPCKERAKHRTKVNNRAYSLLQTTMEAFATWLNILRYQQDFDRQTNKSKRTLLLTGHNTEYIILKDETMMAPTGTGFSRGKSQHW